MGLVDLDALVWREKQLKAGKWFWALVWFCCHEVASRLVAFTRPLAVREVDLLQRQGGTGRGGGRLSTVVRPALNWVNNDVNISKFLSGRLLDDQSPSW